MFLPDPAPAGEAVVSRHVRPGRLDAAERSAVLLARGDARRFGWDGAAASAGTSRLGRLFGALTGIEPVQPLADPRLERLRLFGCMMLRRDARAGELAEALLADGFSEKALREAVGLALG